MVFSWIIILHLSHITLFIHLSLLNTHFIRQQTIHFPIIICQFVDVLILNRSYFRSLLYLFISYIKFVLFDIQYYLLSNRDRQSTKLIKRHVLPILNVMNLIFCRFQFGVILFLYFLLSYLRDVLKLDSFWSQGHDPFTFYFTKKVFQDNLGLHHIINSYKTKNQSNHLIPYYFLFFLFFFLRFIYLLSSLANIQNIKRVYSKFVSLYLSNQVMEGKMMPKISKFLIKRLTPEAKIPTKGTVKAAGYDIHSIDEVTIPAHGKGKVRTGLSFMIPPNTYARVAPRSGLAWKHSINVGAGVIDEDYRGQVCVILFNHSNEDFLVKKEDRIAQVIIEKIQPTQIEEVQDLDETSRGGKGFGSTGISEIKENISHIPISK